MMDILEVIGVYGYCFISKHKIGYSWLPYVGWTSKEARVKLLESIVKNIESYLKTI